VKLKCSLQVMPPKHPSSKKIKEKNTKVACCTSDFNGYANCDIARTQCNFIETQGQFYRDIYAFVA
jgi:hypothetical protein